jgi:DNA polymerase I
MQLISGWEEPVRRAELHPPTPHIPIPKRTQSYSSGVTLVDTATAAADMLQLARERDIGYVGIDSEFNYAERGVIIDSKHTVYDPRSIKPLILSLVLVECLDGGLQLYPFVVDVRRQEVLSAVQQILNLPVPFIGHYCHAELLCLWQLGLKEPLAIWDTWVAERVRYLGVYSRKKQGSADPAGEAHAAEEHEQEDQVRYDLVSTCHCHEVPYPLATEKKRLQQSFLEHPDGETFTAEQIRYAALDAEAAARLYMPQVMEATVHGDLQHLVTIEMPFVVVNARVVWHGVRIDPVRRQQVHKACDDYLPRLQQQLADMGLANFQSHPQLVDFFNRQGLLEHFRDSHGYSFDKRHLKDLKGTHKAIDLLYDARRIQSIRADKILWPQLVGVDGRVHADHRQLGAQSGRQSCRWPNILGLDRHLRPTIVPQGDCGLGEVDLSQIEVGIAAAVYNDARLTEMFNTGDVYVNMAKLFYHKQLAAEDQRLSWQEFKDKHEHLRATMKTCTLGIIYGLTPFGLALRLKVDQGQAAGLLKEFMSMFPALRKALEDTVHFAGIRGYAVSATGLKRYRSSCGPLSTREKNWFRNHPVQASAADVFKIACIRLDRLYPRYGAKLILPVHDAILFECPMPVLTAVAELTRSVLCQAVEEVFPQLHPRAEVNISRPECWNKDGNANALDEWLAKATASGGAIATTNPVAGST